MQLAAALVKLKLAAMLRYLMISYIYMVNSKVYQLDFYILDREPISTDIIIARKVIFSFLFALE